VIGYSWHHLHVVVGKYSEVEKQRVEILYGFPFREIISRSLKVKKEHYRTSTEQVRDKYSMSLP